MHSASGRAAWVVQKKAHARSDKREAASTSAPSLSAEERAAEAEAALQRVKGAVAAAMDAKLAAKATCDARHRPRAVLEYLSAMLEASGAVRVASIILTASCGFTPYFCRTRRLAMVAELQSLKTRMAGISAGAGCPASIIPPGRI